MSVVFILVGGCWITAQDKVHDMSLKHVPDTVSMPVFSIICLMPLRHTEWIVSAP